jgi:AcrR family transcriptional regulator
LKVANRTDATVRERSDAWTRRRSSKARRSVLRPDDVRWLGVRDPGERQARAVRILDVAAELLLRFGYRRVAIDDIARRADIGKGTVQLHWKTRDELFGAVFEREVLAALDELLRALRQDVTACLPHRLRVRTSSP